jgi:hypothetical protein
MLRIVLPFVARTTAIRIRLVAISAVDVRVPVGTAIEVVVDIDVDIVAPPASMTAPSATTQKAPMANPTPHEMTTPAA